ncbi:hypothetical protein [Streptomyces griseofuscus]|uniref:hypothetical protein n=1 Tax=Streptomyces griseofuscus TaxID=146922 RepID=UPI00340C3FC6
MPEPRAALGDFATDDWLPPTLPAVIAERSARVLHLPEPERPAAPGTPVDEPPAPSRRRLLVLGGAAAAALTASGFGAAWLTGRGDPPSTAVSRSRRAVAVQAGLSGPGKALGTSVEHGVRLAVEQHNARRPSLRPGPDDPRRHGRRGPGREGDSTPRHGRPGVRGDRSDVPRHGPRGRGDRYKKALLPMVTAWAGSDCLYAAVDMKHPASSVFQLRPCDTAIGAPLVRCLTSVRPARRAFLVEDLAARDYSWGIAQNLPPTPCAQLGRLQSSVATDSPAVVQRSDGGPSSSAARHARPCSTTQEPTPEA